MQHRLKNRIHVIIAVLLALLPTVLFGQSVKTNVTSLNCGGNTYPYDTSRASFVITSSSTATVTCVVSGLHFPFEDQVDTVIKLDPLSSDTISILFTPTDVQGGSFSDLVTITTDFGLPFSTITLTGTAKRYNAGHINMDHDSLDFGTVVVGSPDTMIVTATNSGKSNLTVSAHMEYGLHSGASFIQLTNVNLKNISADQSLPIRILFNPQSPGTFDDTLLVTTNDTANRNIRVALHGRGVPETGTIKLSNVQLNFGKVTVGQTDTLNLIAKNAGQTRLTISTRVESGNQSGLAFASLAPPSQYLDTVEGSLALPIVFKPSSPGLFYDTVLIQTNDTLHANLRIPIRGEGVLQAGVDIPMTEVFHVSPGIADKELTVRLSSTENVEIEIVDLLGREWLKTTTRSNETMIGIASLPSGAYLCIVRGETGYHMARFVVER